MIFIKNYWFLIAFFISFVGTSAVAQYRLGHVEVESIEIKETILASNEKIIGIIKEENEKTKAESEKAYSENKLEIEKLKAEQKNQTVIRVNQQYLREDMKELKSLVKELATEIRKKK